MSMNDLLKSFELIDNDNHADKVHISGNKNEELIKAAENILGLKFPPMYRLFLKKYGCGGLGYVEVYGLTKESSPDFEKPGIPDGIWLTLEERKTGGLPNHFIIISDTGDGYWYCLDSSCSNLNSEYPVIIWGLDIPEKNKEKVADDFGEFLLQQIENSLDDDD